ncbi:MAG TPA: hypothetical protein VKC54_01385 [Patescibacteria group bacterium]|nr:hypothetical protein [Patescibacteria group bacterium]
MAIEHLVSKEKIHPNEVINGCVNYFILDAIEKGLLQEKSDPKILVGVIGHLALSNAFIEEGDPLPKKEQFKNQKDLVLELGKCAFETLSTGQDVKDLARGKFDPRMIAYAPQALLVYSYLPLLANLKEVAHGEKEYGYGKELDRLQPFNSIASGEMMKGASKRIAEEFAKLVTKNNFHDVAILELGCGNASFSAAVLTTFEEQGITLPKILATDLNPKTQITAIDLFKEKGFEKNLEVMEVDMGDPKKLKKAADKLDGKVVVVHIGYILHENKGLAERTLKGLAEVFAGKNVIFAFSEYYLQDEISQEVPLWFQTIHEITQDLFKREELINFVKKFGGFKNFHEVLHNVRKDNGEIMNSTTYWTLPSPV